MHHTTVQNSDENWHLDALLLSSSTRRFCKDADDLKVTSRRFKERRGTKRGEV